MLKLCILGMSIALVGGVGVVSMSATHEQNENVVNINRENKKLVSYDDENKTFTFTSEELNDYTWFNLANELNTNSEDYIIFEENSLITYNSYNFFCNEFEVNDTLSFQYSGMDVYIYLPLDNTYKWIQLESNVQNSFSNSLTWNVEDLSDEVYLQLKAAIELDIQANMDSSNGMPSIADLFQQVTAAVNAFIGSLGDAFTQVTSLFWVTEGTNQGPTFLGLLILIGVGVGLVYLAYRTIRSLIHRI